MIDVTCVEVQCDSNIGRAAEEPAALCAARQLTKQNHYSRHFDSNCYTLATAAFGSFGVVGSETSTLIGAMAEEFAAREASECGPALKALKGMAVSRIRSALSTALQMGLSQRVLSYLAAPQIRGVVGEGAAVADVVQDTMFDGGL